MKKITSIIAVCFALGAVAQTTTDSITLDPQKQLNSAQRILSGNYGSAVTVGAYGEMLYNQEEGNNGELDVQRLVLLLGYRFNDKTQFFTEIEFEHVEEVFIEQAFVNYSVANNTNLRGGLMLIPMGIINEYHEPTTFNGVERPAMDNVIVPTTWRELGVGISGKINSASLGYQAYIFNGFRSTSSDGAGGLTGVLKGSNGLRSGRQKGIQSTVDSPTLSTKLEYYGLPGLRLGLSGYFGDTQAEDDIEQLDGANIGISMVGLDARYAYQRFTARGQFIHASLSGTAAYNTATGNDLGSAMQGYYVEGAYNLLPTTNEQKLFLFTRYEQYDTHNKTAGALVRNDAFNKTDITSGLSYHIAPGVVLKADYQFKDDARSGDSRDNQLNFGIGVWF
ncbi:OprO/OprP family phosphate-selective porin [Cellulophaga sp. F20128]|uniref:OprO/OprP family phosphate-selective porin n=1 Tax=Cellulophaga sp. F20128 TaxID=2926413 RepID=UPI001FF213BC|nr:OprO/OprP family phosphate-selective porin [Cellulophaga sp. F20128]MCK0157724.1 OprO/OprP family phosphate-selective porin [Cellulophaga sp. F20128]